MAKVKITGHASGTGILTVTAPNTSTDRTITLPDATGTVLTTTSANPASSDGAALGSASLEWSDLYLADSGVIYFGDDQDITIRQIANNTLEIASTALDDDTYPRLTLSAGDANIAVNDLLGAIDFKAWQEENGTDAIVAGAQVCAASEGDFSSSNNATSLQFRTATSGAATTKLSITSDGRGLSQFTARAWARWVGTGTLAVTDSHNVSSVTDSGTGTYQVVIDVNMANANYVAFSSSTWPEWDTDCHCGDQAAGTVNVWTLRSSGSNTYQDNPNVSCVIFGD